MSNAPNDDGAATAPPRFLSDEKVELTVDRVTMQLSPGGVAAVFRELIS